MKSTYYVKSDKMYAVGSQFEKEKILAAARRLKKKRKLPTSVALEEETIGELKTLAQHRGVPYQILMRMFILDGLNNWRVADSRQEETPMKDFRGIIRTSSRRNRR